MAIVSFFIQLGATLVYITSTNNKILPSNILTPDAMLIIRSVSASTANIFKIFSSIISDVTSDRKMFLMIGYGATLITKMAFLTCIYFIHTNTSWMPVAFISISYTMTIFLDRIANASREGPKDALLIESKSTHKNISNLWSFGIRKAIGSMGSILGGLTAYTLVNYEISSIRIYIISLIFVVIGNIVLYLKVQNITTNVKDKIVYINNISYTPIFHILVYVTLIIIQTTAKNYLMAMAPMLTVIYINEQSSSVESWIITVTNIILGFFIKRYMVLYIIHIISFLYIFNKNRQKQKSINLISLLLSSNISEYIIGMCFSAVLPLILSSNISILSIMSCYYIISNYVPSIQSIFVKLILGIINTNYVYEISNHNTITTVLFSLLQTISMNITTLFIVPIGHVYTFLWCFLSLWKFKMITQIFIHMINYSLFGSHTILPIALMGMTYVYFYNIVNLTTVFLVITASYAIMALWKYTRNVVHYFIFLCINILCMMSINTSWHHQLLLTLAFTQIYYHGAYYINSLKVMQDIKKNAAQWKRFKIITLIISIVALSSHNHLQFYGYGTGIIKFKSPSIPLMFTGLYISITLGSILINYLNLHKNHIFYIVTISLIIAQITFISKSPVVFIVSIFFLGIYHSGSSVLFSSLINECIPSKSFRATMFGIYYLCTGLGSMMNVAMITGIKTVIMRTYKPFIIPMINSVYTPTFIKDILSYATTSAISNAIIGSVSILIIIISMILWMWLPLISEKKTSLDEK